MLTQAAFPRKNAGPVGRNSMKFFNDDLEKTVLGELFYSPESLPKAADIITPADFGNPTFKKIYAAMLDLDRRNMAIDVQTVNQQCISQENEATFEITPDVLKELLTEATTIANLTTQCRQLKELSDRRKVQKALENAHTANEKGDNLNDIYSGLEAAAPAEPGEYVKYDDNSLLKSVIDFCSDDTRAKTTPTGFSCFDNNICGGLTSGAYLISAIPGLGKTSFVSQILDCVAAAGTDVLMFNYEMQTAELISRSAARIAYADNIATMQTGYIPTGNEILTKGYLYPGKNESQGERAERESKVEIALEALEKYGEYAGNIFYVECSGKYTVENIRRRIKRHIAERNKKPVVAIDYLQIVPAINPKQINITEIVSANMTALKQISRDFDIPIIIVSATARENYAKGASLKSFKDSGSVEYAADFAAVLYYSILESESEINLENLTKEQRKEITLHIVKCRRKSRSFTNKIKYRFEAPWFMFRERSTAEEEKARRIEAENKKRRL